MQREGYNGFNRTVVCLQLRKRQAANLLTVELDILY